MITTLEYLKALGVIAKYNKQFLEDEVMRRNVLAEAQKKREAECSEHNIIGCEECFGER